MSLSNSSTNRQAGEKRPIRLEALASIGRLSVSLIHEMGNPLDGVRRYVRLLIDQMPEEDPRRVYAEQAQDGLALIANMIHGLMDFIKNSMSESTKLDVKQSMDAILLSLGNLLSTQKIEVETEFGEDIPPTNMNTDVVYMFTNILRNAIQAMPDGGTLSISAVMVSSQLLEVRINDTGAGIPSEIREKIFDAFFTTRGSDDGIGLGLFISREIAASYDGSIEVESESGKETSFIVRLPMYRGKILVMDDEKHIRDLADGMLSSLGYKVVTAVDGAEAIKLYKESMEIEHCYDTVILDLTVPGGMNGKQAMQKLVNVDPGVKAIASSGYTNDPLAAEFRKYGFKGFLDKPYGIEELEEVLREVIMSGTDSDNPARN